jgi:hypothetical protein
MKDVSSVVSLTIGQTLFSRNQSGMSRGRGGTMILVDNAKSVKSFQGESLDLM